MFLPVAVCTGASPGALQACCGCRGAAQAQQHWIRVRCTVHTVIRRLIACRTALQPGATPDLAAAGAALAAAFLRQGLAGGDAVGM